MLGVAVRAPAGVGHAPPPDPIPLTATCAGAEVPSETITVALVKAEEGFALLTESTRPLTVANTLPLSEDAEKVPVPPEMVA